MKETVAAILLAAGRSRRMGRCKQLLPLGETTVIGHGIDILKRGGITEIVVVVAQDAGEVAEEAQRQGAALAVISGTEDGDMATSLRCGRDALPPGYSGVLITLCDYPLVLASTVALLTYMNKLFPDGIVTPVYAGRRGHPLLIARPILNELTPGYTLRDLLNREPARVYELPVEDPGILIDMDTPEDYSRILCWGTFNERHESDLK